MFTVIIYVCVSLLYFILNLFLAELSIICIWTTPHSKIILRSYSATCISLKFLNIHNEMIKGAAFLGSTVHLEGLLLYPL